MASVMPWVADAGARGGRTAMMQDIVHLEAVRCTVKAAAATATAPVDCGPCRTLLVSQDQIGIVLQFFRDGPPEHRWHDAGALVERPLNKR